MIATSIAVSAAYMLLAVMAFVAGYRAVRHSERSLTLYVLVATVLRMLSAAAVLLVFFIVVKDSESRITFVVTFSTCYLLMLVFDALFFIRSQKSKQQQTK